MGWYGTYETASKDDIRECFEGKRPGYEYAPGMRVTDATWRGTTLWGILRQGEQPLEIVCWLVDRRKIRGAEDAWAYKPLSEVMGPAETSCPLRLLSMVPCPAGEWAASWRDRVRSDAQAARERRAVRRGLAIGDWVVHNGDRGVVVGLLYRGRRAIIADFPDYRGSGVTRRFRIGSGAIQRAEVAA